jgi:hypothetical protein
LFVDLMRAAARGIRRTRPDAVIMTPDPTNMYPGNGIREMESFIRAGMLEFCDVVAIHPYRPRPEEPDFDADTQALLTMLDRYGFAGEIWFTEGIYFTPYRLPRFGLEPTRFSDFWRCGPFSYDIGTGERICAAYQMRMWLTALKYARRVRQLTGGVKDRLLDMNRTPRAVVWAPNTLGHLLGDASFVCDLDIGEDARGYLFEDGEHRPVAVIWNTDPEVDDEKTAPTTCSVPFGNTHFEVFDAFGARLPMAEFADQPILPLPTFIRGRPGAVEAFRAAFAELRRPEGAPIPVAVRVTVRDQQSVVVALTNRRARPVDLEAVVAIGTRAQRLDMQLKARETRESVFPLSGDALRGISTPVRVELDCEGRRSVIADEQIYVLAIPRAATPPVIDGDLSEWEDNLIPMPHRTVEFPPSRKACGARLDEFLATPPVWRGPQDLSARFGWRWDSDALYLAVEITDDVVAFPSASERTYMFDSLQIYFDTAGDARSRREQGYDNNDWSFDIAASAPATEVWIERGQVPEWQLCFLRKGPAEGVRARCIKTDTGYTWEIAFPADEIRPLRLEKGTVFGMALLINENDNDYRKRGLTLTPDGTEPHQNPHLYPAAVLMDKPID